MGKISRDNALFQADYNVPKIIEFYGRIQLLPAKMKRGIV